MKVVLWKEHESSQSKMEKNGESSNNDPTMEIQITAEHVTVTNNQVSLSLFVSIIKFKNVSFFWNVCLQFLAFSDVFIPVLAHYTTN